MNVLRLTLHGKWFRMILSGKKKEEYRERKEYWIKRILAKHAKTPFTHVEFTNGYGKHRPKVLVELDGVCEGKGRSEWGAYPGESYIILKLGRIITAKELTV